MWIFDQDAKDKNITAPSNPDEVVFRLYDTTDDDPIDMITCCIKFTDEALGRGQERNNGDHLLVPAHRGVKPRQAANLVPIWFSIPIGNKRWPTGTEQTLGHTAARF
jgi:hypothetical protein